MACKAIGVFPWGKSARDLFRSRAHVGNNFLRQGLNVNVSKTIMQD